MSSGQLIEKLAAVFALILLIGGSLVVLAPFATALLWGAILAFSSWHPYSILSRWLGNRRGIAALVCVLLAAVIVLGPFVYAGASFSAHVDDLTALVERYKERGVPQLPEWLSSLPYVGSYLQNTWNQVVNADSEMLANLRKLVAPVGHVLLGAGLSIGAGLGQLALSIVLAFFFYTGGELAVEWLRGGMRRIAGERADHLLALAGSTVKGVVYGVLGTAFVQAVLTGVGLWIAGVPGAAILGFITFFLSVIPVGPPLIWIPAALWLYHSGATGWAIFMVVWGIAVVGMADNIIKPLLISKGTGLPLIWIMMGVLGGALAFGFLGVFIGPTVLAVAYALLRDWTIGTQVATPVTAVTAPPPTQLTPDA
ncbi:AI-2E family transporter [Cupriavidus plantarum]|uniref:Putative PurR-regulated permease PerM n=1 Tax=Cupriavidus plantarum TaxID=942865 RepID=A0A316F412_9BURK|nr:AI-2E family transporter [Cupriavidus plantarum]NYH98026.1 putative PurR-regulated permease PerM [Cupriavidus plantarum]PWK38343.1 putative PurR-regulated permease PerM [Cupriavidus plantarum]REE91996.1 putative PurR-regulated permease PerM [Cupriavidus plantarum]CAG2127463.1 Putative transport protein YdiK [Cupriavidus plantarum]SMR67358.1 Predicted PurR-regulated permease PerM [Cupriavidus plantarum]